MVVESVVATAPWGETLARQFGVTFVFGGGSVAGRLCRCLVVLSLFLLGAVLPGHRATAAGSYPHIELKENDDVHPITLEAGAINSWSQDTQDILLLKGAVAIEHDVFRATMDGAVIWIDHAETQRTGILHARIFADGGVQFDNGSGKQTAGRAWFDIYTRGATQLRSAQINATPAADDALYRLAASERVADGATGLQQVSAQDPTPAPAALGPPVTVVAAQPPAPTFPGPLPPTVIPTPPPTETPQTLPPSPAPPPVPPPTPAVPAGPRSPTTPAPARPPAPIRQITVVARNGSYHQETVVLPNGEQAAVFTGGIILIVRNPSGNVGVVDIEADNLVLWAHGSFAEMLHNIRGPEGQQSREMEVYLQGDVELREQNGPNSRFIRAAEVYYDLSRNVAIANQANMAFKQPRMPDPIHLRGEQIRQLSLNEFTATRAEVFSSRLPSDPGLKVVVTDGNLETKRIAKRNIFGFQYYNPKTGQPEFEEQQLFDGRNMLLKLEDVPIFYWPYVQGDANDPLGPLREISSGYNRIFGFELKTTWNGYDLIGVDPIPGTRWDLEADYLSARGPALGTNFDYSGDNLFNEVPGKYVGTLRAYGIYDTGQDILGGDRGPNDNHPTERGRLLWRQYQELPDDFTVYAQLGLQSDQNFLEQFFLPEFQNDLDEATFVEVKKQFGNAAATFLVEPDLRPWLTQTAYLPDVNLFLIGQSFFDLFTYNGWASATYAQISTSNTGPPPVEVTQQNISTGRLDFTNELSLPFTAGPFRLVPYVEGDVTYYTEDLAGNEITRLYGAAGLRASIPFTRIYPDIQSDLLNLDGINHKIVASSNFYFSHSTVPFTDLPQVDMLNDPITDQALRDIRANSFYYSNPATGPLLATSPLFDPQYYALHTLLQNSIDTRDSIDALEFDVRQRWQTKRGYPGNEHIVDFMTLDISATFFPDHPRGNGGVDWALVNYDWTWNLGDRTALFSSGLFEPVENGARVFTIGGSFNRPDRTSFYLGYRQIDPIESKAVTAAVTYIFSPKYSMTASSTYDFGTQASLSNSLVFTRMGSDLEVSGGITYNAILNTFGVVFTIVPNFASTAQRVMGPTPFGSSMVGH